MKKPKTPCKDCIERAEGCWSKCRKWVEYKKKKDEYDAIVLEEKRKTYGTWTGKPMRWWT